MSKSRVVNSAVNTIFNFSVKLFDFGIKFVLRTVFIYTLGMQYVGVSGLFTDILSVLSFVELGIAVRSLMRYINHWQRMMKRSSAN